MDPELNKRISTIEEKVDAIWKSVEKTRKIFVVTVWVTVAIIVLPLIAAAFIIPSFISSYTSMYQGLL